MIYPSFVCVRVCACVCVRVQSPLFYCPPGSLHQAFSDDEEGWRERVNEWNEWFLFEPESWKLNVDYVQFVSTFVTLGVLQKQQLFRQQLARSPRIRLFVLQQPACGTGYISTVRVWVCGRDRRQGGWQQIGKKRSFHIIFFSDFELLCSAAEIFPLVLALARTLHLAQTSTVQPPFAVITFRTPN